jgi:uncharacterized protein YcgL (UPF0745 family)
MEKYQNCNFAHIRDLLHKKEKINISISSVKRILKSHGYFLNITPLSAIDDTTGEILSAFLEKLKILKIIF